jgi:hypothetical protein
MKKILIASLVGGLIIFAWQAISWMVMPIHLHTFQYAPAQDTILDVLKNSGLEDGAYFMPTIDNRNASSFDPEYHKKGEAMMKERIGKPMAVVFYKPAMEEMGGGPFIYGLLYDLIAVLCACLLLSLAYQSNASFLMRWWMVMLFAVIYVMQGPMAMHNWMMEPWHYTKGFIYDAFIGWGLTGLWLAGYLKRK